MKLHFQFSSMLFNWEHLELEFVLLSELTGNEMDLSPTLITTTCCPNTWLLLTPIASNLRNVQPRVSQGNTTQ